MDAIKVKDLYDLTHTRAAQLLETCEYPWEALDKIGAAVGVDRAVRLQKAEDDAVRACI